MTAQKKILVILFLFIVLKIIFRSMNNDDLQFLLYPTNLGVELATNSKAMYLPSRGYLHQSLNIVIDKSCSGFNFFLISYLLSAYAFNRMENLKFALVIVVAFMSAYLLAIFANISRILCYLVLLDKNIPLRIDPDNVWLHRAEGILVYLSFLIIFFLITNFITHKINTKNETTSKP